MPSINPPGVLSNLRFGGIDIGGTKILAAITDGQGQLLAREYRPTPGAAGPEAGLQQIIAALEGARHGAGEGPLAGVGLAIAGLVDSERGVLVTSPHLPSWKDAPLKAQMETALGVPTYLVNDANAAALGELHYGAGRGAKDLIYITVSTGIGGGIIIGGQLYTGACGSAGEIGHMVIEVEGPTCNCGNRGCLESLASGTAVAREMARHLSEGAPSLVREMVGGRLEDITAQVVAEAAERGDALAQMVIQQAATYLGVGLANLVNIFNPELILIGGGLVKMGIRLLEPARAEMQRRAFALPAQKVRIMPSALGDEAGVRGAVAYLMEQIIGKIQT